MEDKKDHAMRQVRNFSNEFKKQVVEELISGSSRPSQICRRYSIAPSLLDHWKKQYNLGKFDNEPVKEAALQDRIEKLERLVGKITLENEFLKKAYQYKLNQQAKSGKSSSNMDISSKLSKDVS
jgi:transposase-like protein